MASGNSDQILFRCDACGKAFRVPAAMAGQAARCSGCGKLLSIPGGTPSTVSGQLRGHTTKTVRPVALHDRTQRRPSGQVRTNDAWDGDEITSLCCQCGEEYSGRNPSGLCPDCTAGVDEARHRSDAESQDAGEESGPVSAEVCPACRHPIRLGAQTCRHCGRDFRAAKRRRLARGPSEGISLETALCSRCGDEYEDPHPLGLCPDCRPDDTECEEEEPQDRFDAEGPDADDEGEPEPEEACPDCGHPNRPGARRCSHCGYHFRAKKRSRSAQRPPDGERSPRRPVNTLATAALCLGLAGLSSLALPFLVFLSGAGLVLGVLGLKQIGSSEGRLRGKGLAVTGIMVSAVSIVFVCIQAVQSLSDTSEADNATPAPQLSQPALPPPLPSSKKPGDQ